MKLSNELIKKAKECKSAEEVAALAKQHGVELTDREAAEAFARLGKTGELADSELNNVSGGSAFCYESNATPIFSVGDKVRLSYVSGEWKITYVHSEKRDGEFTYDLKKINSDEIITNLYEHFIWRITES